MGVVWVHWLMARGQILKESLVPLATPYRGGPRKTKGFRYRATVGAPL